MPNVSQRPHQARQWRRRSALALLSALLVTAPFAYQAMARPTQPDAEDRQITNMVRSRMESWHLTGQRVDDTVSERCMDSFLKALDPWKLYFLQSDIDEFHQNRHKLDDLIRDADVSYAYKIFSRFLARVEERTATALEQIDVPHDFTVDETMIRDRDDTTYSRTPEDAAERWRKRVKFDMVVQLADGKEMEEAKTKLRKRYDSVRKRWFETDDDELLELYLTSMTSAFDPHSSYMSKSTLEDFDIQMRLELDGIGAALRSEDGYTTVQEIIAGGAADRDGKLKEGDIIVSVGQGPAGTLEDIVDMKLRNVVKLIRGKRGTIVRLEVKPADNPKELKVYEITRDRVELKNQEARGAVINWGRKQNGEAYKIGVISLPSFYMDMDGARKGLPNYRSTTRDVSRLLRGFNQQHVDAVVVDLRFNGGGSLQESVAMTGLFIDRGPVVQVKGPDGRSQPHDDDDPGMLWSGPLVVMTNKFSASASEIFAGAIQDYGRGVVVGDESTHGKGTVQQLFNLAELLFGRQTQKNWGALKLTIQQFYRPGGDSTQNRGVVSDVVIPSLTQHIEGISERDLDYALSFDQVRELRHDRFGMVNGAIKNELQRLSSDRITQSPDFKKDLERISRYEEQKDEKTVTLNLDKYLAEKAELDADKEQEEQFEKATDSDRPVFDMEEHYNKEAMSIVADYLRLLGEKKLAVAR